MVSFWSHFQALLGSVLELQRQLRQALLGAYWEAMDALPERVKEAIERVALTLSRTRFDGDRDLPPP